MARTGFRSGAVVFRSGAVVAACVGAAALLAAGALAAVGSLQFVNAKVNGQGGVDGIVAAYDVAVSPNGRNVYVKGGSAIATFKRSLSTGKLHFVNAKFEGVGEVDGIGGPGDVTISRDGKSVYVTGHDDDGIATFKRNGRTGKLHFVNAKFNGVAGVEGLDGPYRVEVSHDDRNVYVTTYEGGSLATFKRNGRTGKLHFVNAKFDNQGGVNGLDHGFGLTISPDDKNVYATGETDSAIATFRRNLSTGKLHFVNAKVNGVGGVDGLESADGVVVSRDRENVYVVSDVDNAIATFRRNLQTGKLHFVNAKFDGQGGINGLAEAYDAAVSRDGRNVYAAGYGDDAVAVFKRNRRNGKLRFLNAKSEGVGGVHGLAGAFRLEISPDGDNVYVAAYDDSSVVTFKRRH